MPNLGELTELECKLLWQALAIAPPTTPDLEPTFETLFGKVYRAYRHMPPGKAA